MKMEIKGTFHRKELPPPAVAFSSMKGRKLFKECCDDDFTQAYFPLSENYITQGHPAFCGIGSLTMTLNSMLVDPGRVWQGIWRWFDESMLNCCESHDVIKIKGISLPKVACLARCNGATAQLKHANTITEHQLREDIKASTSSSHAGDDRVDTFIIASYSRSKLNQSGDGHFSPIGAYNSREDMVLIMDVARFKYPPHWVPLSTLFEAMSTIDTDTGLHRGYIILSRKVYTSAPETVSDWSCCLQACDISQNDKIVENEKEINNEIKIQLETQLESFTLLVPINETDNNIDSEASLKARISCLVNHTCPNCSH